MRSVEIAASLREPFFWVSIGTGYTIAFLLSLKLIAGRDIGTRFDKVILWIFVYVSAVTGWIAFLASFKE